MRAPGEMQRAIRGRERRQRDASLREGARPAAVRSEPRPGGAAEREDRGVGRDVERRASRRSRSFSARPGPKPRNSCRSLKTTPCSLSLASSARSSGDALKLLGKTRPLVPTKVSSPSPAQNSRKSCGEKARRYGLEPRRRSAVARQKEIERLAVGEIQPAAPGHQELCARGSAYGRRPRRARRRERACRRQRGRQVRRR